MARVSLVDGSKVISTTTFYDIEIQGVSPLIMNKIPDLTIGKGSGKNQAQKDKFQIEQETWREKIHTDADGMAIIPRVNLWKAMISGAKMWGAKIPGKGHRQYSGIMPDSLILASDLSIGVHKDDESIQPLTAMCNGTPTKGARAMVPKIRPCFMKWGGEFRVCVADALLTPDILATCLSYAGRSGLGDWRPLYGGFKFVGIYEI